MALDDGLSSRQLAQIIDLLCEGEIEGFPNAGIDRSTNPNEYAIGALKDVFFNNTPVLRAEATITSGVTLESDTIKENLNFDLNQGIFETKIGGQDQVPFGKFSQTSSSSTTQVNTEVPKGPLTSTATQEFFPNEGTPVTRTITDVDVDQVNITVGVPALSRVKHDTGTIKGAALRYKIQIQYNGDSGFTNVPITGSTDKVNNDGNLGDGNFQIRGYTPDLFQRTHEIKFTAKKTVNGIEVNDPDKYPINIRVIRTTNQIRKDDIFTDDFFWYSFDQIITDKLRYPNTALFASQFDAQQFPSIPKRTFRIRGLKVRIPHNASVRGDGSLEYAGTFNGTFKAAREWCSDPAWILYDLLTNTRYGLGAYILTPEERKEAEAKAGDQFEGTTDVAANLDVYSFQQASAYCSGRVSNNAGGTEARFSCNVAITSQQDAYKLVQQLCSVFRAMPFWEAGTSTAGTGGVSLAQDRPEDFTYIFNQSNVTVEGFSYSGSSMKGRPTCVAVRYFDMEARDFRQELVELNSQFIDSTDPNVDFLDKYGYNKQEIDAFACTSRSQAYRLGKWFLYTSHRETEVCSFSTDVAAGIIVRPGDYIKISDPVRTGRVVAGRVTSGSTLTQIKLDRSDTEMFGETAPVGFEFHTIDTDGKYTQVGSSNIVGNTVTLGTALNALSSPRKVPAAGAPFQIGYQDVILTQWRVLTVEEGDGVYNVTAAAHVREKYDIIEDASYVFPPRSYTQLAATPDPVTNLQLEEITYEEGDKLLHRIAINWQQSIRANYYEVEYRFDADNPITVISQNTGYDILDSEVGTYSVKVRAVGYDLDDARTGDRHKYSSATTARIEAIGKSTPPNNIASLNISPVDAHNAELYWPRATDLDVRIGGTVEIRHTPHTDASAVWGNAQDIVPAVNGSSTRKIVPLKEGTYLIRAKDSIGNYSAAAGIPSVVVDLPEPQDLELVQTYTENPTFGGTFTNTFLSETESGVALISDGQIDDITDFDDVTNIDFFGETVSSGEYQFASTLDLGAKYDVELLSVLQVRAFQPNDTWDERTALIDTWNDIDANDLSDTDVQVYVRSTNDDPSGTPTYGTWEPFVNNTKRGRGFQFKAESESSNVSQNPLIEQLGVKVSLQRRTEQQRNITSGTSAKTITFPSAFYSVPSVGITAQDFDSGDYFQLSSISRTGFTVTFKNSSDTIISKVFDYQAVGHGKEIT